MYYHRWEKGRIVRKEFHLTSDVQYAFGFGLTCTLLGGLLVLFLMSGCGAPEQSGVSECLTVVSPEPILLEATEGAARRIEAASGCVVAIAPMGVPIKAVASVWWHDDEGNRIPECGGTQQRMHAGQFEGNIDVRIWHEDPLPEGCVGNDEDTVAHELLHVLMGPVDTHASSGIFAGSNPNMVFNDDSLTFLCSHVPCTRYQVEPDR